MLGDVVVPGLPVDEVVKFQKIEPGPIEEMRERGWRLEVAQGRPPPVSRPVPNARGRDTSIPSRSLKGAQALRGFIRIYL